MERNTDFNSSTNDFRYELQRRSHVLIAWFVDDVLALRPDLSIHQAWEVLEECRTCHDSDFGYTSNYLNEVAENVFPLSGEYEDTDSDSLSKREDETS